MLQSTRFWKSAITHLFIQLTGEAIVSLWTASENNPSCAWSVIFVELYPLQCLPCICILAFFSCFCCLACSSSSTSLCSFFKLYLLSQFVLLPTLIQPHQTYQALLQTVSQPCLTSTLLFSYVANNWNTAHIYFHILADWRSTSSTRSFRHFHTQIPTLHSTTTSWA